MPEVRCYLDHPGFFLQDAAADLGPEDVPSTDWSSPPYIGRTDRMIAIGTIASVDGEVQIWLDEHAHLRGTQIFQDTITTPSGSLVIMQSSGEKLLRTGNLPPVTMVQIGVDDVRHPQQVHVRVVR